MRTLITIVLLLPFTSYCQEGESALGKYKINKNFCLRADLGWNKSWFSSLGASYVFSSVNQHTPFHVVVYASIEANLANYMSPNSFYAYKAGIEAGNLLLAYGFELRNNTDFTGNNHLIFTPKAGLSFFGHANLMYGYNVFRTANNIFGVNHSQLSISVNLNRKIFKESFVPGGDK
jgi:hypothetical protein